MSKSRRGKRRGKYDEETIAFCVAILSAAESNATIKNGLNTRITHDAVFSYNRRELVQRGVSDVAEFTRIIRAHQAREQRRREKSAAQTRPKNGIMRGMRKNAKHAPIFAAAIVGGMAAPMRSDASEWVDNSSQTNPRGAAYTVKTYTEGSPMRTNVNRPSRSDTADSGSK